LVLSCVDLRTKGFQPSCAQNRLAQNQNCIRLGLGRFSEVPTFNFISVVVGSNITPYRYIAYLDIRAIV